jgi:predicted TIM-barrel fold metal-dependent hydrolase
MDISIAHTIFTALAAGALDGAKDATKKAVSDGYPSRYAGFAHLPLTDPDRVGGRVGTPITQHDLKGALVSGAPDGRYLDYRSFEPLLARAEKLDVPIYLRSVASPKGRTRGPVWRIA